MKKTFITLIMLMVFGLGLNAKESISYIKDTGSWYYVYNESGKKVTTMSASQRELIGWGSDFFIVDSGSWYYIYDMYGKKISTLSNSIGKVISVSSNTFTVEKGSWLYIYSRDGKKIKTMSK
jgi:hypothetical protein